MFALQLFLESIATLVGLLLNILIFLLVVRVILSWFQINPYHELAQIIYKITDPLLFPFRKLPLKYGGLDFTPIISFICLYVLNDFLVRLLKEMAHRVR